MSAAAPEVVPTRTGGGDAAPLQLICCCDEDTSICGMDVSDEPWGDETDHVCVVCMDLWPDGTACPRCGCWECAG